MRVRIFQALAIALGVAVSNCGVATAQDYYADAATTSVQISDYANPGVAAQPTSYPGTTAAPAVTDDFDARVRAIVNSEVESQLKKGPQAFGKIQFGLYGFPQTDATLFPLETGMTDPATQAGFRRLRFGLKGDVNDNMKYKVEIDFSNGSETRITDAWLGWKDLPNLQELRLGNHTQPFGMESWGSSSHQMFVERNLSNRAFNPGERRFGAIVLGHSQDQAFNWQFGAFAGNGIAASGSSFGDNQEIQIVSRLASTVWYDEGSGGRGYAHAALSAAFGDHDPSVAHGGYAARPSIRPRGTWYNTGPIADVEATQMLGVEGVVNVGKVQVWGAYHQAWAERVAANDLSFQGGHVSASYFITGEHSP
ncbi:MAG: OprO/OprP family phosphate-selective porin, partial [Pirellulaceae bacterium]|nr:OprO/OprP family phosphate-selective porin [Pirellulaceae bacterium]